MIKSKKSIDKSRSIRYYIIVNVKKLPLADKEALRKRESMAVWIDKQLTADKVKIKK